MGFLNAMILSSERFKTDLLPAGYRRPKAQVWVIDVDGKPPTIGLKDMRQAPATPADRTSGKVSPSLLVDKLSYALGIPDDEKQGNSAKIAQQEHEAFVNLLKGLKKECSSKEVANSISGVLNFLAGMKNAAEIPWPSGKKPKSGDLVTFQVGANTAWLTDDKDVQKYWEKYVETRLKNEEQVCVLCGQKKAILRILPFRAKLFGYQVQVSSFNKDAFESSGKGTAAEKGDKKQASSAPICFACASVADQVLQYLLKLDPNPDDDKKEKPSGRHAVILARDDSKGKGKQPLRNQIAVFWTRVPVELAEEHRTISLEDLVKIPLDEIDMSKNAPPPETHQIRTLMESPFVGGGASGLVANRFYLAVLSPNKSRLVVREWLEHDVTQTRTNIANYGKALRIAHPDGRGIWYPPLRSMLESLQSYTSSRNQRDERPRLPQMGPDMMRKIVRCIYAGDRPPMTLLTRAIRCFRVPDPPADNKEQNERQMLRRMAMAAAMKLVLTYNKPEQEKMAMEQSSTEHDTVSEYKNKAPYRCGQLLAVLEAIQRRASSSGRGVNATLVDRFYGAASTAPTTVFANLMNMTTKAHLSKLRRENKEVFSTRSSGKVNISELMAEICSLIDDAGGFPPPLTAEEQAQFALGFYHQRTEFNPPKA